LQSIRKTIEKGESTDFGENKNLEENLENDLNDCVKDENINEIYKRIGLMTFLFFEIFL
jgi:hypothetical protein